VCLAALSLTHVVQLPQFHSSVTGIGVPVLVRSGGEPVRHLTAADFVLTDSGVRQEILAADGAVVPLDITVVAQEAIGTVGFGLATFEDEITTIGDAIRPDDRFSVMLASRDQRRLTLPVPGNLREVAEHEHRCAPVYDALSRALMQPTTPDRQSVILLIAEGEGWGGFMSTAPTTAIARRSNARLYVVGIEPSWATKHRSQIAESVCPYADVSWSPERQSRLRQIALLPPFEGWRQLWLDGKNRLVEISELTGGREIRPTMLAGTTAGPIRQVLDEARASYVLYYTPRGVPDTGWHPISVKVTRSGNYDVRVRAGYQR
jgi:hypothetical protein